MQRLRRISIGLAIIVAVLAGSWSIGLVSNGVDSLVPISASTGDAEAKVEPTPNNALSDSPSPSALSPSASVTPSTQPKSTAKPSPTKSSPSPRRSPVTTSPKASASPKPRTTPSPSPSPTRADESVQVLAIVNAERAEAGCDSVRLDAKLSTASVNHSTDMARRDYFSHYTPEGKSPWQRAREAGYDAPRSENIATGQETAAAVMESWMRSLGHRNNILDCTAKAMGIGLARNSDGTTYWTQMFGTA